MTEFLQFLVGGLSSGLIYGMVAIGWVWVYSASGILNLVQGQFVVLGGLLFARLETVVGLPVVLSIVVTAVGCGIAGALCDLAALQWLRTRDQLPMVLLTLGLTIVLQEVSGIAFGHDPMTVSPLISGSPLHVVGVAISRQTLLLWCSSAILLIGVGLFFRTTRVGLATRACADNRSGAETVGIPVARLRTMAFAASAALAGVGGVLLVPITAAVWNGGFAIGIPGFIAAAIGSLTSYGLAAFGGLSLGMAQALFAGYVSSAYGEVFAYGLLLLVLLGAVIRTRRQQLYRWLAREPSAGAVSVETRNHNQRKGTNHE